MEIPSSIRRKWKKLQSKGDLEKLCEAADVSEPIILKAMNKGESTFETFEVIKNFL